MSHLSVKQKSIGLRALLIPLFLVFITSALAAQSSVLLTWTAPGDDGSVGRATVYDLRYSTTPINSSNWGSATRVTGEPLPKSAGGLDSMLVNNLSVNVTYYFALKSADEVQNWSALSNLAVVIIIADTTRPAPITDLEADGGPNIGDLVLTWTATGDDGSVGTASYYRIACSTDSATTAGWYGASIIRNPIPPLASGTSQSYTIAGLVPGQRYWVAIRAYDEEDNYQVSNLANGIAAINISADADDDIDNLPDDFELSQNYPNPFNPVTVIDYSLGRDTHVDLSIYNVLGQHIVTLVDRNQGSGRHSVTWEGLDKTGRAVSSGMYLYVLKTAEFTRSMKMLLQK